MCGCTRVDKKGAAKEKYISEKRPVPWLPIFKES